MNTKYTSIVPRFKAISILFQAGAMFPGIVMVLLMSILLAGSVTVYGAETADSLEPVNRVMLRFNRNLDSMLVKPVAKTYQQVTPGFVKTGVRNFFNNLGELGTITNDLLQLRLEQAASDLGRFAINSTVGLGGMIDVATPHFGLVKHDQDFGRTLAHWGVESGLYLVLPVFGPSTLRDTFGLGADQILNPLMHTESSALRDPLLVVDASDTRASYLPFDELISGDEYLFVRELYLQRRNYQLGNGTMDVVFEEF